MTKHRIDLRQGDWYAKWSYDQFRLQQPHIVVEGLWKLGQEYYILCPNMRLQGLAADGAPLAEWFESHKASASPVRLTDHLPDSCESVEDHTTADLAVKAGKPRTVRDFKSDLSLELPRHLRKFRIDKDFPELEISFAQELTEGDLAILQEKLDQLQLPYSCCQISTDPSVAFLDEPFRFDPDDGDLNLIPSAYLKNCSRPLHEMCERDEEFWIDNRLSLFSGHGLDLQDVQPEEWDKSVSQCLVMADLFPPCDIRNFLSLYRNVVIVLPVDRLFDENMRLLGLNEHELVDLVAMDRVKIALPQSIDRYRIHVLNAISDVAPANILLSRRLAAMTILDARSRIPLLFPPIGMKERYVFLHAALEAIQKIDDPHIRNWLGALFQELGVVWSSGESMIHDRGAFGTAPHGVGRLVNSVVQAATGKNLFLEFLVAAESVEWAGALGVPVFARSGAGGFSEDAYLEFLARIYTGIPGHLIPEYADKLDAVITNLLSISKDVPVVEFAKAFGGGDIDRLRRVVMDLVGHKGNKQEIINAVEDFNRSVRAYERRSDRLETWNVLGLVAGLTVGQVIPLGSWLVSLLTRYMERHRSTNPVVGSAMDAFVGLATVLQPNAILVHRMKSSLISH